MATIYVDHHEYTADPKQNLLDVCLSLGFNLPYFCWHPAMGSVGACRQCAVKQFNDERDMKGRLVMACMTPAADGTRISIEDPEAKAFRETVIEWLMTNHPHDCPVCDEGGECHLQDMTVMTGHTYRRYRFKKRTYRNQYLGPFIKHDMNRCIECYRCVRFYRDTAGGRDFDVFGVHNGVYFGRHEDGVLENEFSGNLIEVCPTGVFVDNTLMRHYTRKWDLQTAPSVCVHCGVGCNTTPGERYGILRRIANRFNSRVNGYFLCDRGRFSYEFVNHPSRIRRPYLRGDRLEPADKQAALHTLATRLSATGRVIGIGSARASLEANFALRTLVGPERFHLGVGALEARLVGLVLEIMKENGVPIASLDEIEQADAVFIMGEDILNTAPRAALALLQSLRQQPMEEISDDLKIPRWHDAAVRTAIHGRQSPLFIAGYRRTWLHDFATDTYDAAPADVARLGFAVAHEIDSGAPQVGELSDHVRERSQRIAATLSQAKRPVILSGTGSRNEPIIRAAARVTTALITSGVPAKLYFSLSDSNSLGAALLGGKELEEAFGAIRDGTADTIIVLENDLYRHADQRAVDACLEAASSVIVLDQVMQATAEKADALLPAGSFAEADGTLVNNEGRAQRFYRVFIPREGDIQESWRWLRDLAAIALPESAMARWENIDDVIQALIEAQPAFQPVARCAPPAGFRIDGMKIPRQPKAYSGRTAMFANVTVHEPKPPEDPDSPLAFSMEGYRGCNTPIIPQFWAPGWNSNQALNKFQVEVGGPLREETPGVRLFARTEPLSRLSAADIPPAFQPRADEWLLLPLHHIFGSDELGSRAPAIAERMPAQYLALNPADAARKGLQVGGEAVVTVSADVYRLTLRLDPSLPLGIGGWPLLPTLSEIALPAWATISPGAP
ncbi:MAG: NADH-quinone oxidoreductase subunit NuoG [Nitrospiraceae bacterium]|nr:NADH-quinone oxidoreductase subunit NuoG [Nitrospiraceae bacterium]